jgi:predicted alpha/beta superfamily hydrolase
MRIPSLIVFFTGCVILISSAGCGTSGPADAPSDPIPSHDELRIVSAVLKEDRHINIYLPPGYDEGDAKYPVLYMLDGGLQEDFPHIAGTIEHLIDQRQIAPVILVGIENTERRRDLTGPTTVDTDREIAPRVGGSAEFRAFVREELIPAIQESYRCTDESAIIGESLAGLFIVETLLLEPSLFDRYIAMDPSLWWNNHQLVDRAAERLKAGGSSSCMFWFASSGTPDIRTHALTLEDHLKSSAPKSLQWKFEDRPSEEHSTIFRATKEAAMTWALWKLLETGETGPTSEAVTEQ